MLLDAEGEDWAVWTDWYDARLRGDPADPALETARALIGDKIWKQGPKAVNAEIRRLIEGDRGIQDDDGRETESENTASDVAAASDRIVRVSSPADFVATDDRLDIQLKPVNPEPAQNSTVPIDVGARDELLRGLHGTACAIDRQLQNYSKEDPSLNRVRPAEQIAGIAREIAAQTANGGAELIAPLFHRLIEAKANAWLEDAPAFEAVDRELIRGFLEDARKLYPYYPVLAELNAPMNLDLIPVNLASEADSFVNDIDEMVNSKEGREVFTEKTREVVAAEKTAVTPEGLDEKKWKIRRFGALVGKMLEKLRSVSPSPEKTGAWIKIAQEAEKLWSKVAPYLGYGDPPA